MRPSAMVGWSASAGASTSSCSCFGSARAVAPVVPPGDIDIAVGFVPGAQRDLLGVIEALGELVPGEHLDVMDLDRAGPVARVEALVGGRVLFESGPCVFTRRELQALGEYLDTAYLREALLRELAR